MNKLDHLTDRERRFVDAYLATFDPTAAAAASGEPAARELKVGKQMLASARIRAEIERKLIERAPVADITHADVLQRYWQIATADPNELTQLRRVACRYCYGVDHLYQWIDVREFTAALEKAQLAGTALPSVQGGYGYSTQNLPVHLCPQCSGQGIEHVHIEDTRFLSQSARALYAGVEVTKGGLRIKMHDQLAALDRVAKHIGFLDAKGDTAQAVVEPAQIADKMARIVQLANARKAAQEGPQAADPDVVDLL